MASSAARAAAWGLCGVDRADEALRERELPAPVDLDEAARVPAPERPEPDDLAAVERPDDFAAVERPDDFAAVERPDDFAAVERPDDFAAVERPDDFAAVERPDDFAAVERPDDFAAVERFDPEADDERAEVELPVPRDPEFPDREVRDPELPVPAARDPELLARDDDAFACPLAVPLVARRPVDFGCGIESSPVVWAGTGPAKEDRQGDVTWRG